LRRKSQAPSFIASTADCTSPKAVMTMTCTSESSWRTRRSTERPSVSGSRMSRIITWGLTPAAFSRPSAPVLATSTA
jgi:hypothetical protein